jgi:hypothetical protein
MGGRRVRHPAARTFRAVGASLFGASLLAGMVAPAATAQTDTSVSPLCLLSADEMGALLGAPIAAIEGVPLQCAYSTDPSQRQLQVVLSLLRPDPTTSAGNDDPLFFIRFSHDRNGEDTQIAGLPAWVADDGAWVNLGPDLLIAWPNVVFDADPPVARDLATRVLDAAVPRYLEHPAPSPSPSPPPTGAAARFPAELAGDPLDVSELAVEDALSGYLMGDAPDPAARPALRDAMTALAGGTLDPVSAAIATQLDFTQGGVLTMTAFLIPGADASSLVDLAARALIDFQPEPAEAVTIAGRQVTRVAEAPGGQDRTAWFLADGDVLWALVGDEALVEELLTTLPPAGGPA